MSERVCYDRYLPDELPSVDRLQGMDYITRAAFWNQKLWPNGTTLRVAFMGGTSAQQATVAKEVVKWSEFGNIKFEFGSIPGSHIRVKFGNDGAWSYIGRDAQGIPLNQNTMNLGWLDGGVILHEFGHAIGMIHEHQNPLGRQIEWNKSVVNRALSGPPNYWDQATINSNIYAKYAANQINGSALDPLSIMMYFFPKEWTLDGFSTSANDGLSDMDKLWVSKVYPGAAVPPPPPPPPPPGEDDVLFRLAGVAYRIVKV